MRKPQVQQNHFEVGFLASTTVLLAFLSSGEITTSFDVFGPNFAALR
jgi:hypothetical protein